MKKWLKIQFECLMWTVECFFSKLCILTTVLCVWLFCLLVLILLYYPSSRRSLPHFLAEFLKTGQL